MLRGAFGAPVLCFPIHFPAIAFPCSVGRFWFSVLALWSFIFQYAALSFGGLNWTMRRRKAFPCSVALVSCFAEAFPCSVALVFRFWGCHWVVQHGLNEGVKNMYKTNAILHILKMKGLFGEAIKTIPENKNSKKRFENKCLARSPRELFGAQLGCSIFWCAQLGCSDGAPKNVRTTLK